MAIVPSDRSATAPSSTPAPTMSKDVAQAKALEALRLLREIHAARHSLREQMASNGRRFFMVNRFTAWDAVKQAERLFLLLSDCDASQVPL